MQVRRLKKERNDKNLFINKGLTLDQASSTKLGSRKTTYIDGSSSGDRINDSLVVSQFVGGKCAPLISCIQLYY